MVAEANNTEKRPDSPEKLNDYIKISRPVVWIFLSLVILFLIGVCIWGVIGRLETTVSSTALVENGTVTAYVPKEKRSFIKAGQKIMLDDAEIASVEQIGTEAMEVQNNAVLPEGESDTWWYPVTASTALPDGIYPVEIITESIRPIAFLFDKV